MWFNGHNRLNCYKCVYDLRVMIFNQQIVQSYLTVNIHWPCFVLLIIILSVLFVIVCGHLEWKQICSDFFCLFISVLLFHIQSSGEDGWNPINTAICSCLSQGRTWIFIGTRRVLLSINDLRCEVIVHVVDICGIGLGLWCLKPLSTILSVLLVEKTGVTREKRLDKNAELWQVTDKHNAVIGRHHCFNFLFIIMQY